ncbi:MAG TPA: sugar ABC transporter permease [Acidobacteriota bacterium]|nr:sugar ABC transporter permease [Acidobacteriota bacterium]
MIGRSEGTGRMLLLLPAAFLLGVVVLVPVLRVIVLSLSRVDLATGATTFVGLDAYGRLWTDARWWSSFGNTLVFTASSVAAEMILGVAFALVLHRSFRGRGIVRAIVVLPWALPTAVMALAWGWIFNDAFGVANDLLQRLRLIGTPVAWLGTPATAMAALVVADVWKTTPFVTLVVLAGLQSVPAEVLEAARLDGLSAAQRLRRVVLPLLVPTLLVALAFRVVQAYGAFDLIYVLTGGGPGGSTETVSLYAFQNVFRYLDFGYGGAVATQAALLLGLAAAAVAAIGARGRRS